MTKQDAEKAFHEADKAWNDLLPKVADARYLKIGQGEFGTPLNEAYRARESARVIWEIKAFGAR